MLMITSAWYTIYPPGADRNRIELLKSEFLKIQNTEAQREGKWHGLRLEK